MVQKNNRNDGDVHIENHSKPPKPLKKTQNLQNPWKTQLKLLKKSQNLQKKTKNLEIIQTSQNNRSRLFGKIIATMVMVGNVQK